MRDNSIHKTSTGKVFQMLDGFSKKPIPYENAKHNYTRSDLVRMEVGQSILFMPMYGNENPVYSRLLRLK